jgi:cell shape-determining protein MreC
MSNWAAELFPQHTKHTSGADAVFDAIKTADETAADHQRLIEENAELRCRIQELEEQLAERSNDG